mgnify:CR=1 FL=1
MDTSVGTPENPLRVAIVGSGPAGFYAAESLFANPDVTVEVDMFDRLPTPFGLVRAGVAPDHPKIKNVIRRYEKTAANEGFRFFGNVEIGTDVEAAELADRYHAVIYGYGTSADRKLGIPGEDLPGSHPATAFVAWYNAHPDFADAEFDRVVTVNTVAIWPDLEAGLRELHRVTRPGGRIVIAWHGGTRPSMLTRRLALPGHLLDRIEGAMAELFAGVTRHALRTLTAFRATRPGDGTN